MNRITGMFSTEMILTTIDSLWSPVRVAKEIILIMIYAPIMIPIVGIIVVLLSSIKEAGRSRLWRPMDPKSLKGNRILGRRLYFENIKKRY